MTSEEYWHGPPRLCAAYREADRARRERLYVSEWRQGLYVQRAVESALDLMLRGSSGATVEYFEAPLVSAAGRSEEEAERREMERQRARMMAMAAAVNVRFEDGAPSRTGGEDG